MAFRDVIAEYAEKKLGVHRDFLFELFNDGANDDWLVVVKLHAFIESACTERLSNKLGDGSIDYVSRMSMGGRTGKVALLEVLGMIATEDARFIDALSSLRNKLIHRAANIGVRIADVIATQGHELQSVVAILGNNVIPRLPNNTQDGNKVLSANDVWRQSPGLSIWWVGLLVVYALAN